MHGLLVAIADQVEECLDVEFGEKVRRSPILRGCDKSRFEAKRSRTAIDFL
jgi:hypothetical protein